MVQRTEPQLIQAVMRGDANALGQLLQQFQGPIYNVCFRMVSHRDDAAEVAQDAMLKIVEHVKDFQGGSDIATWMIRIAINQSISHLRKRRLRQTASLDAPGNGGGEGGRDDQGTALRRELPDRREPSPESSVQQREMIAHLHEALGRIDDEFRAVLVLRDLQEMDYAQIAEAIQVPLGTVKSRLFRARLALRHEMLKLAPPLSPGRPAERGAEADRAATTPRPESPAMP